METSITAEKNEALPLDYRRDDARVFYTTMCMSKQYLRCLVASASLFDQGLLAIVHGFGDDNYYTRLLAGDFEEPALPLQDVEVDEEIAEAIAAQFAVNLENAFDEEMHSSDEENQSMLEEEVPLEEEVAPVLDECDYVALTTLEPFKFTFKVTGQHGGCEARCPFHRKNDKTDCKKYLRFLGPCVFVCVCVGVCVCVRVLVCVFVS